MLEKEELAQVLRFVSGRWNEIANNPNNKAMNTLPSDFWMNSIGGRAGKGHWITMLMYTENAEDAETFKSVLLRWQATRTQSRPAPDLIQIKRGSK